MARETASESEQHGGEDTRIEGVQNHRGRPIGSTEDRKINRNAVRATLNEKGFIGAEVTMATRDYALVDLTGVIEARREVAEVYFEHAHAYFEEPEVDGYQWGIRV